MMHIADTMPQLTIRQSEKEAEAGLLTYRDIHPRWGLIGGIGRFGVNEDRSVVICLVCFV